MADWTTPSIRLEMLAMGMCFIYLMLLYKEVNEYCLEKALEFWAPRNLTDSCFSAHPKFSA